MASYYRPDRPQDSFANRSTGSQHPGLIGPSAHWTELRRHAQSDVLASQARSYILKMLKQDPPGQGSRQA